MNSEIKFRAWNENYKQMKKVYGLDLEGKRVFLDANLATWWLIDHCELMQYTGIKDKNGREIYKGYIIEYSSRNRKNNKILIVNWSDEDARFAFGNIRSDFIQKYGEVIGNIYENPELLEGEQ